MSRLLSANYSVGADYTYGYDVAGNMVNNNGVTRTYNAANQMTNDGTNTLTYDDNGNLTNDGVNAYTWDRANRMLTALGSTSYKYDGMGNRIQQTVSSVVTAYLNDVQPGLTQLLAETVSGSTTRYVQGVRGIHATESHAGVWSYFAQDGLGSVRGVVDNTAAVVSSQSYNPMGVPATDYGKGFGFTGEFTDTNDLLYLRARYYAPSKGVFTALDPMELLNRYSYVNGNPINYIDPSGLNNTRPWRDPGQGKILTGDAFFATLVSGVLLIMGWAGIDLLTQDDPNLYANTLDFTDPDTVVVGLENGTTVEISRETYDAYIRALQAGLDIERDDWIAWE